MMPFCGRADDRRNSPSFGSSKLPQVLVRIEPQTQGVPGGKERGTAPQGVGYVTRLRLPLGRNVFVA